MTTVIFPLGSRAHFSVGEHVQLVPIMLVIECLLKGVNCLDVCHVVVNHQT